MEQTVHRNITNALLPAIQWLLKPVVKLCIEKGISYTQLRELLKQLYVDVADEEFTLQDKRSSDSRIFLLTGVHRKDVRRLRNQSKQTTEAFKTTTLGGELVAHWLGMDEFINKQGQPRSLLQRSSGDEPGFDALLASVSKDIRPRVVLDEWLRLGIISLTDDDKLQLNQDAFVPQQGFAEKTWYLGRNIHDHIAACSHNLLHPHDKAMLERSVYYTSLSLPSIEQLRDAASQQANTLLKSLNQQALAFQQTDKNNPQACYRMRFGTYWFELDTSTTDKTE